MNTATIQQRFFHRYRWLLALGSLVSCLLFLSPPIHAQAADTVQITLSPTNRTMDIKPDATYHGSFTIFNSGSEELNFTVYAAPYRVKNQSYDPLFTAPADDSQTVDRTQISRWVSFPQEKYSLAPGDKVRVPYTITTPASIPDGGQYAALFAQTETSQAGAINSQKRVGMLLYAHSNGTTVNRGTSDDPKPHFLQTAPTFALTQTVSNSGNTDFMAQVTMSVSDIFGNEKYNTTLQKVVLPDTTRGIQLDWEHTPPLSLMKVTTTVTIFGKTTNYTHTVLFVTPTALFFVAVILLLIIAGGIYVFKRRSATPHRHDQ